VNFFGIGGFELIVIAGLAFFLLGPKKMIETSRDAGKIIRELKAERDKFTKMVMEEYEAVDDSASAAEDSTTTGASDAGLDVAPVGAVSRPRGRVETDSADEDPDSAADSDDTSTDDEETPSAGGPA
jgi:Sec-independent protein translocase protein TatA